MQLLRDLDPDGPDMTVHQLAACINRSPRTVYRWLNENRLPGAYQLPGNGWLIPQRVILDSLVLIPADPE